MYSKAGRKFLSNTSMGKDKNCKECNGTGIQSYILTNGDWVYFNCQVCNKTVYTLVKGVEKLPNDNNYEEFMPKPKQRHQRFPKCMF